MRPRHLKYLLYLAVLAGLAALALSIAEEIRKANRAERWAAQVESYKANRQVYARDAVACISEKLSDSAIKRLVIGRLNAKEIYWKQTQDEKKRRGASPCPAVNEVDDDVDFVDWSQSTGCYYTEYPWFYAKQDEEEQERLVGIFGRPRMASPSTSILGDAAVRIALAECKVALPHTFDEPKFVEELQDEYLTVEISANVRFKKAEEEVVEQRTQIMSSASAILAKIHARRVSERQKAEQTFRMENFR